MPTIATSLNFIPDWYLVIILLLGPAQHEGAASPPGSNHTSLPPVVHLPPAVSAQSFFCAVLSAYFIFASVGARALLYMLVCIHNCIYLIVTVVSCQEFLRSGTAINSEGLTFIQGLSRRC